MTTQPTCAERINGQLADRLAEYRAANEPEEIECPDCEGSGDYEETTCPTCDGTGEVPNPDYNDEGMPDPLAIEIERYVDITLSTGGPADGFRLFYDSDGDLTHGEYWFKDWYDGATTSLDRDDAQMIAEAHGIYLEPTGDHNRY